MFFPNSRSRFKSKPPRIFVYCLEFVCLVVLLTLLIAQLRAVELPSTRKNVPRQRQAEIRITNQNEENVTSSIDRDDQISAHDGIAAPPLQTIADAEAKKRTIQPLIQDAVSKIQSIDFPKAQSTSYLSNELYSGDDLFVSPATAQSVQAAPQDEFQGFTGNGVHLGTHPSSDLLQEQQRAALPSLAEMTAAGTATGMLIHDLVTQANMIYDKPAFGTNREITDSGGVQNSDLNPSGAELDLAAKMQQLAANDQQQGPLMQDQSDLGQVNEDGESNQQPPMLSGAEAVHRLNPVQTASDPNEAEELASEDDSPDSIESLMGADGADLNDGAQDRSMLEEQPQQLADSNLINSNEALASQLATQAQHAMVPASSEDDEDDSDEKDSPKAIDAQSSRLRPNHYEGAIPVLGSYRHGQPGDDFIAAKFGSELEQNLVAPMRESLVDLNTAAGHYHGKKKKVKKVKKIIIKRKKKKKKKKKMMKYKKVEIVKIKKKRKKAKKHHGHHHDHGKYYMYAKVPKKKAWEFGFKKGNKKHWIERHEKGYKNKFKTKVKWYDKKSKGKGVHIWDYNHHDKKKKKHH